MHGDAGAKSPRNLAHLPLCHCKRGKCHIETYRQTRRSRALVSSVSKSRTATYEKHLVSVMPICLLTIELSG